jgi:hypothetical protein
MHQAIQSQQNAWTPQAHLLNFSIYQAGVDFKCPLKPLTPLISLWPGSPLLRSGAMLPAGCGWCVQTVAKIIGHGFVPRTRGETLCIFHQSLAHCGYVHLELPLSI